MNHKRWEPSESMLSAANAYCHKQQIPMPPGSSSNGTLKPLAEELGIDPALITFEVLRRTFQTAMQKYGTMKDVQAHLRHASR
jgi:hypothetical protein